MKRVVSSIEANLSSQLSLIHAQRMHSRDAKATTYGNRTIPSVTLICIPMIEKGLMVVR